VTRALVGISKGAGKNGRNRAVVREKLGGSNPTQRDKGGALKRTLSTWRQMSRMCKGSDGNVWNDDAVRRLPTKSGHQDHSTQE
jgi:hypothetical protein